MLITKQEFLELLKDTNGIVLIERAYMESNCKIPFDVFMHVLQIKSMGNLELVYKEVVNFYCIKFKLTQLVHNNQVIKIY